MDIPKEYQCQVCHTHYTKPQDACSQCGDQFYWRLQASLRVGEIQRREYVDRMANLVGEELVPEFLTHGDELWLPHCYWAHDPKGEALECFLWIEGVEPVQHERASDFDGTENGLVLDEDVFEALKPDMLSGSSYGEIKQSKSQHVRTLNHLSTVLVGPSRGLAQDTQPGLGKREKGAPRERSQKATVEPPRRRRVATDHLAPKEPVSLSQREWFAPLMLFLLLLLLSMSYLVLRYHKNTRFSGGLQSEVIADEFPVLS